MSVTTDSANVVLTVIVVVLIVRHWRSARGWSRQAMTIKTTTMTVSTTLAVALALLTVSQAAREPRTSSRFAGQLASQPLNAGSQNSIPSRLKPAAEAYSAT